MTIQLPKLGLLLAASLLLSVAPAAAIDVDPTQFTGRILRSVELDTPRGTSLAQLAYLVEQQAGDVFNPQSVRRSVELLFRLGQFDDVRARVTPNDDGSLDLVFVLEASPRLAGIRLRGARGLAPSAVRASLAKGRGDPYVQGDEARLARDVESFYRARGFLDVIAIGHVARTPLGGRAVRVDISAGPRYRIDEVRFLGEHTGFGPERLAQLLGDRVARGRFYGEDRLNQALERLIAQLQKRGFVEARLLALPGPRRRTRVPVEVRKDSDTETVSIGIPLDAGHLVEAEFVFDGARRLPWNAKRLEEVVGLNTAARVSRTYAEDAARQLERFLWRRGHYHAEVKVAVFDEPIDPPPGAPEWTLPRVDALRVLRFMVETGPEVTLLARDIETTGNEFLSRRRVIGVLSDGSPEVIGHRPAMAVILGFDVYRRYFSDGALTQALDVLKDWYRARGYLAATATGTPRFVDRSCAEEEPVETGQRVCLDIQIAEGPRTTVESLAIDDRIERLLARVRDDNPDAEQRRTTVDGWKKRFEGKPFNPARFEDLVQEMTDELGERGYIDARVQSWHEISTDGTLVRLGIDVQSGDAVRFGKVVVRDNRHTQVGFIRRQVPIRPGSLFKRSQLQQAQGRLLRTGLFDGAILRPAQLTGRLRDVEVLVNERKRFSFVLGGGFTWPDDGPRVSGETRLRNLDGRGLSVWARGRMSLDWRFITAKIPLFEYRASVGMELPYLPGLPLRAALTALINEELDEPTYRISRSGITFGVDWRPSSKVTIDAQAEVQLRAPIRVDSVARLNALADIPTEKPRQNPKPLVLGTLSGILDFRDDRLNPTQGVYASATLETTPGDLVAVAPAFGRLSGRTVIMIPFDKKGFGLRLEVGGGVAWSYDGRLPPVEWRFRLGGTSTVRGYRLDAIGPWGTRAGTLEDDGLLADGYPTRQVPVGGNAFYRGSIQLQFPLPGLATWRFVVFGDGGNALIYGDLPDGIDSGVSPALQWSVGFGLRRITPIGPLRLELALRPMELGLLPGVFQGNSAFGDVVQVHFAVGAL
jgi:outer membrane protein assembly factor BamA